MLVDKMPLECFSNFSHFKMTSRDEVEARWPTPDIANQLLFDTMAHMGTSTQCLSGALSLPHALDQLNQMLLSPNLQSLPMSEFQMQTNLMPYPNYQLNSSQEDIPMYSYSIPTPTLNSNVKPLVSKPELASNYDLPYSDATIAPINVDYVESGCLAYPNAFNPSLSFINPSTIGVPNLFPPNHGFNQQVYLKDLSSNLVKQFQCHYPTCGKLFKRTEHLKRHLNTVHTDFKPFVCRHPQCHKRFSRSDNLSQHVRTHRSKPILKANPN